MAKKDFVFDCKLTCTIRVNAETEDEARALLSSTVDCSVANLGAWPSGAPILCEVSLDDFDNGGSPVDCVEIGGSPNPRPKASSGLIYTGTTQALLDTVEGLLVCSERVIDQWTTGELAEAVNELEAMCLDAHKVLPQKSSVKRKPLHEYPAKLRQVFEDWVAPKGTFKMEQNASDIVAVIIAAADAGTAKAFPASFKLTPGLFDRVHRWLLDIETVNGISGKRAERCFLLLEELRKHISET